MDQNIENTIPQDPPNNLTDHYVQTGELPQSHIRNKYNSFDNYPRLQRLIELKRNQYEFQACKPFSCRISALEDINKKLEQWSSAGIQFDVVMVGSCNANFASYTQLLSIPIHLIASKPSFLFLWLPTHCWEEGRKVLAGWGYRRAEDIVYLGSQTFNPPTTGQEVTRKSTYHCLMGIKGTVRRSVDGDLIHCNVNTDIIVENENETPNVSEGIYNLIENFSLSTRRLHIMPTPLFQGAPMKGRPGWVTMGYDVETDNFSIDEYHSEMRQVGDRLMFNAEIESLRPKSPTGKR